ncbi:hypothetical protein V1511DRAFT_361560 [Dipodascopsis uninucleata]
MVSLLCHSAIWIVDDFSQCFKERYMHVAIPIIIVLLSFTLLIVSNTVRVPKWIRKPWFGRRQAGYSRLDLDLETNTIIDEDDDGYEPIYRLRTTDANAEYDDIATEEVNVLPDVGGHENAVQQVPNVLPSATDAEVFMFNASSGRRTRIIIEVVFGVFLSAVHTFSLISIMLFQYPSLKSERMPLLRSTFASCIVALHILWYAVVRLSPNARFHSPYARCHAVFIYYSMWVLTVLNVRSDIIYPSTDFSRFIIVFDLICFSVLMIVAIFTPLRDRPAYQLSSEKYNPPPLVYASVFDIITFSWVNSIVKRGYSHIITMDDVWDLAEDVQSAYLMPRYLKAKQNHSMLYGVVKYFKFRLLYGIVLSMTYSISSFAPTILVRKILIYLEDTSQTPRHMAWTYVVLLFIFAVINATCSAQTLWTFRRTSISMRAVIIADLFAKALKRKVFSKLPDSAEVAAARSKQNSETAKDDGKNVINDDKKIEDETIDLGRVINLMAVDSNSIIEVLARLNPLIRGISMILVSMILLYQTLGPSAIAGIAAMLTLLPINYKFAREFGKIQKELLAISDRRIQKTNEVMQSIKIIKFFAWEDRFGAVMNAIRREELKKIRKRVIILAIASTIWLGFPTVVTFITFWFYTSIAKRELTPAVAFSSLSLFNLMRTPMDRLSEMATNVIEATTSIERVQKFLNEEETKKYDQLRTIRDEPDAPLIGFKDASFAWGEGETSYDFKLQDLNITFEPGKLTVIVGATGAGKTSLLLALLGEMNLLKGRVYLPGCTFPELPVINRSTGLSESVAYCAQTPWLLNASIRENIIFGNKYSRRRYREVVRLCALIRDFEILDSGDQTQVGEKGISLSGGQKQRISLARALYSPARHVILDDCLSAVDSHTALYLYENCITGPLMTNRTCILVSHNVALTATMADKIIVMETGHVVFQGTADDVVDSGILGNSEQFASFLSSREISRSQSTAEVSKQPNSKDIIEQVGENLEQQNLEDAKLDGIIRDDAPSKAPIEIQQTGMVKLSVYRSYFQAMGNSWYWLIVIAIIFTHQGFNILQSYWVRVWSSAVQTIENYLSGSSIPTNLMARSLTSFVPVTMSLDGVSNMVSFAQRYNTVTADETIFSMDAMQTIKGAGHSTSFYIMIYGAIGLVYILMSFVRELIFYIGSLNASRKLFEIMSSTVLRAKPRFFDVTPVGQIINRFSKDIESIDREVGVDALGFIHSCLTVAVIVGVISSIVPGFIIVGLAISVIFFFVNLLYLNCSRELKRMHSVTRSPIYQHFGETLTGISTIRAYGYEQRFVEQSMKKVDTNSRPFWIIWACNRWMCFRTDLTGGLISFFAGVLVVYSADKIDPGLAGMILTYAITFTESMFWVVLLYADNEINMNSVERVQEYLSIEQEAPAIIEGCRPPSDWPAYGQISVKDLSLRYAPDLPQVIKNISFEVKPGWKVGIVGRTGAGKSTIASAFFRFLEPDTGSIVIDGIDIAKIGLQDLRRALAIIPQDPTLFAGTVRSNLDPFETYTDQQIFTALKQVHLIEDIPGETLLASSSRELTASEQEARDVNVFYRLDSAVTEGGQNLSQGQRQLMCLARSLLKSPKIILLDEATASIDYNTDSQIQDTIRTEFTDSTILTIAHRLRSIIDYDKILVLDAGVVREYDSPYTLLQQDDSIFRDMCRSSGELDALEALAKEAFERNTALN